MNRQQNREIKWIFRIICIVFFIFLVFPVFRLLMKSFMENGTGRISFQNYREVLTGKGFLDAVSNSVMISICSGMITTILAFCLAYTIHYTNVSKKYKSMIEKVAVLPMLLPTITYGFAIIYSFGKQGLFTKLFGRQLFDIYGFTGLLIGYVIYTLPISFLLIHNTMGYIDKKFMTVSRLMGDSALSTLKITILRPLVGTIASSFIQTFFLCFTDFGIPASVGGKYSVVASVLYTQMLGSVPDFGKGAIVAFIMLLPSIVSIFILKKLEKYNIRYQKISMVELPKSRGRDFLCTIISGLILLYIIAIFAVIFLIPFIQSWPYRISFTTEHIKTVFVDSSLIQVYQNSLLVALLTAIFGTLIAYGGAIITERISVHQTYKQMIEGLALITNTIPGMVIGIAYLFTFSGTPLQNTFPLMILCNVIHFFSTPYFMMKNALSKMNRSWETTAMLMGDSWLKTMIRIVTPNAKNTLLEIFGYYFINAMVTVSAVIFIAGARTMVIITKIKELQYFSKYNEIFVLSILILITNLCSKWFIQILVKKREQKEKKRMKVFFEKIGGKKVVAFILAGTLGISTLGLVGCGNSRKNEQVIIYSNADDEAVQAMKHALDSNGYEGEYIFQTFGTAELGGKLLAEGTNLEADLVTMSTFYIDTAQKESAMFQDLDFETNVINSYSSYQAPITAQEGTMIVNTEMMKENQLSMPTSLKELGDSQYKGFLSVTDLSSSSTAWLLIQGLLSEYEEDEAKEILKRIYENAGDHIESSGSAPLKKVRAGEVAIGFGLRQQAVADKESGLPIDYIDPLEGNFSLTESLAVVDKGEKTKEKAMEMAQCIIENARPELQTYYPIALYEGEENNTEHLSAYPKVFQEPLTVELLKKHQQLSEESK